MVIASSLELGCHDLDSHLGLRIFSVLSGDQIEKMTHEFLGSVAILPSCHNNGWTGTAQQVFELGGLKKNA